MMRTLYRYIIFSYFGPFVLTLCISLFVLVMQFLWLYIEDLAGKGIELKVLGQIFYYVILTLVPLALPLAILLSSIMTFGSLGEHYELAALKSAGLSLQKIMQPLIIFTFFLSIAAFFFSNNVLPYATLKWRSLIFDVSRQKPAITIKEGIFYNGINKYVIRVEKKDPDGKTLHNIMIYDHTSGMGNTRVTIAESGKMEMSDDLKYFIISLQNGHSYNEIADPQSNSTHPLIRTSFKEQVIKINLSGFEYSHTNEDLFKSSYEMLNLGQIKNEEDTLHKGKAVKINSLYQFMTGRDSAGPAVYPANTVAAIQQENTRPGIMPGENGKAGRIALIGSALSFARAAKAQAKRTQEELDSIKDSERFLGIVWHKKFTLSIACIVLFFIGAPLGAIIRKGGLGMPVVVSIILFILYWVISITGEKISKEGLVPPYIGMWISTFVLLPVGIFLTSRATADSGLFDIELYLAPLRKLFSKKNAGTATL